MLSRSRSIWSKVNRDKVLALIAEGRMQPAGLKEIERARADGRWDAAYDSGSQSKVPPDLQTALDAAPAAKAFFATLDSRNRYAVLFRLQTAKRADTRARRIESFVAMLARGEKLAVLGRNGAGKSTLIRLLGGIEMPTHGHIELGGTLLLVATIGAPAAIVSAIEDALQPLDVRINELPVTPVRLRAAIKAAHQRQAT